MGVPYGVGQGLNEGVKTAGTFMLEAMKINQANKLAEQRSILALNWARTQAGLPPLEVEDARSYLQQMTNPTAQPKPAATPATAAPATPSEVPALSLAGTSQPDSQRLQMPVPEFQTPTPPAASPAQALIPTPSPSAMPTPPPMKPEGVNPFASGAFAPRTRSTY